MTHILSGAYGIVRVLGKLDLPSVDTRCIHTLSVGAYRIVRVPGKLDSLVLSWIFAVLVVLWSSC